VSGASSLRISVLFPHGWYSGADYGSPEELPSPARLHEALTAAAAGGPWATVSDRVLVAADEHRAALEWLETTEPLGIIPPRTRLNVSPALRYRWRTSPVTLVGTDFESRCALDGPIVYVWPQAPDHVVRSLQAIAREVTHVGIADSIARVYVEPGGAPPATMLKRVTRRGPGRVLRVARPGRTAELIRAHREASRTGAHTAGSLGKQAYDEVAPVNEAATSLQRFAPETENAGWPFDEVWVLPVSGERVGPRLLHPSRRVGAAAALHRAIVRAIGEDVPAFVTGRDGEGPLRNAGHLAIQLITDERQRGVLAALGVPNGASDADRELLRSVFDRPLRFGFAKHWFTLGRMQVRSALPFWHGAGPLMRTEVPLALDTVGRPRHAPWSINDAVTCSVAYAMRAVLERHGVTWGKGWDFRRDLVARMREEYDVRVLAARVPASASPFVHRANEGELVVAARAVINLGRLAPEPGGFLALGRARHMGGGLLVPLERP
jgi:CRISPR-associated protein Csb2